MSTARSLQASMFMSQNPSPPPTSSPPSNTRSSCTMSEHGAPTSTLVPLELSGTTVVVRARVAAAVVRARSRRLRSEARTKRVVSRLLCILAHNLRRDGDAALEELEEDVAPPPESGIRLRS